MITVSVSVDVPSLEQGIRFYSDAFGFAKIAEPYPGVVVLHIDNFDMCLLEKPAGSHPSPFTPETRHYDRHWTPVLMDLHVEEFDKTLEKSLHAGATQEQFYGRNESHGSVAFCSDPFGNGFCLIEQRR